MEKIIDLLVLKYNLSEDLINKIVRSEFLFVKDTIEQGDNQSVHLQYLGKFGIKPNRLLHRNKNKEVYGENN